VFDHPGRLGDSVEIWCRVERAGTTSLTLDTRVLVREIAPEKLHQICQATVVYVALDKAGRPMPWKKN
jgi:acyl-CoA hydrolase